MYESIPVTQRTAIPSKLQMLAMFESNMRYSEATRLTLDSVGEFQQTCWMIFHNCIGICSKYLFPFFKPATV